MRWASTLELTDTLRNEADATMTGMCLVIYGDPPRGEGDASVFCDVEDGLDKSWPRKNLHKKEAFTCYSVSNVVHSRHEHDSPDPETGGEFEQHDPLPHRGDEWDRRGGALAVCERDKGAVRRNL